MNRTKQTPRSTSSRRTEDSRAELLGSYLLEQILFNRTVVRYRIHLESYNLASGTINVRLAAIRRFPVKFGPSHKYDHKANPDAGAEIEAHPKNVVSPVFTRVSHLPTHESIFQSVTNPEITQTGAPAGPPTRYVEGDIHKHDQGSRAGRSNQTNRDP